MRLTWDGPHAVWERLYRCDPSATIFQSPAWADAHVAQAGRCETLHASFPDGRQAVLPVGVRTLWKGLIEAADVGFGGGYGGPLADGPLSAAEQEVLLRAVRHRFPEHTVTANPFREPPAGLVQATVTQVLTLAPLEQLRRGYARDRQKAVRRYQAAGVSIAWLQRPNDEDRRLFWSLYQRESQHWHHQGRSVTWLRSQAWFEAFWRQAGDELSLAIAFLEGEPIGAQILAVHGEVATMLFHAWDHAYGHCQVSTALIEACFAEALARGCRYVDAMPSGGLQGVEQFKSSFGSEAWPVWGDARQTWLSRTLTGAQRLHSRVNRHPARVHKLPEGSRIHVGREPR